MGKVGRFVVNPSAGAYCQVRLDSGDTILVSHEKGGARGDSLSISVRQWWGFASGETLFTCRLEEAEGRGVLTALLSGAPDGSAQATPLGALVHYVKDCASPAEVKAKCWALFRAE
jgi:hypothetical protein